MVQSDLNNVAQLIVFALGLAVLVVAGLVYGKVFKHLHRSGGGVNPGGFQLPELLVALVLATFFGSIVLLGVLKHTHQEAEMKSDQVFQSALVFAAFAIGLGAFLHFRKLRLTELLGLARLSLLRIVGWAALLLAGAFPFVIAVSSLSQRVLGEDASEQDLVTLFRHAAERGDYTTLGAVIFAGVVIAPPCEEFLFRGFFYGVGKRYIGAIPSGLITAVLFAAFHGSLTALPGLLVLALALVVAYERTGCLFVPITMHALFNATSLTVLYLQATGQFSDV